MHDSLLALLGYLDASPLLNTRIWHGWHLTPITGGANNLLYRATNANADYVIKFTVRDERNRAQREYAALTALHQVGLPLAPRALLVDQVRYRQPVVVQSWLDGATLTAPPETDADWESLLHLYCAIHSLTPAHTSIEISSAVLNVDSGVAGKALVHQHVTKLPPAARPDSLQTLLEWFDAWTPPTWEAPSRALCRVDANWRNFIRRTSNWASVDWENSGWGDPAFELADLITHPAYEQIPTARWEWLIAAYTEQCGDPSAVVRIHTYTTIMLIWWVVRGARYLYEVPRGLDPRLAQRPPHWHAEMQRKYARFVARAQANIRLENTR